MKNLEKLLEQYNFDYIIISPEDIDNFEWEFIPEEILIDCVTPQYYIGSIKVKDIIIEVYRDERITSGDVILKYKDLKKERNIKLKNIIDSKLF